MWIMRFNKIIEQLAMQKDCAWLQIVYLNKWVHDHMWGKVGNFISYSRNLGFSCSSYACLFHWNASWREIVNGLSRNSQWVLSDSMACLYFAMVVLLCWSFSKWSPPEVSSSRSDSRNGKTKCWACIFKEKCIVGFVFFWWSQLHDRVNQSSKTRLFSQMH